MLTQVKHMKNVITCVLPLRYTSSPNQKAVIYGPVLSFSVSGFGLEIKFALTYCTHGYGHVFLPIYRQLVAM